MGWKTPFLMIKKGNFFDVQAISAPIFRDCSYLWQSLRKAENCLFTGQKSAVCNSENGHYL